MDKRDIEHRFTVHLPKGQQEVRYKALREEVLALAYLINSCCPECRDKDRAFDKLDQAWMLANAAIARTE